MGIRVRRAGPVVAAVVGACVVLTSPASAATGPSAAYDDSFAVSTRDGCGSVEFVDYGEGAPGGGSNDDYTVIHDYCSDGHGVMAWANVGYNALGKKYNGNGLAGGPVIWDPFAARGNVFAGETVELTVCLVDGANDETPFSCATRSKVSQDG